MPQLTEFQFNPDPTLTVEKAQGYLFSEISPGIETTLGDNLHEHVLWVLASFVELCVLR